MTYHLFNETCRFSKKNTMFFTWKLSFSFLDIYKILCFKDSHFHEINKEIETDFHVSPVRSSQNLSTDFLTRTKFTNKRGHFTFSWLTGTIIIIGKKLKHFFVKLICNNSNISKRYLANIYSILSLLNRTDNILLCLKKLIVARRPNMRTVFKNIK